MNTNFIPKRISLAGTYCDKCCDEYLYDEKYESLFCANCNEWSSDEYDEYCENRPIKPLLRKYA